MKICVVEILKLTVTVKDQLSVQVFATLRIKKSTCQTRDAGHSGGLEQSQPGHTQQGVNLTLIAHTYADTAHIQHIHTFIQSECTETSSVQKTRLPEGGDG